MPVEQTPVRVTGNGIEIKDLSDTSQIQEDTHDFIFLRFYATNYDFIVNYLTPFCKLINNSKKYLPKTKKISKAWQVFFIIEKYDSKFFKYIKKILVPSFRNSIVHNNIKKSKLFFSFFDNQSNKKIKMSKHAAFNKLASIGLFINLIQETQMKLTLILVKKFLKKKKLKTKAQFKEFAKSTRYWS